MQLSIKKNKIMQGYCHSGNRPACSNCRFLTNTGLQESICEVGAFIPTASGWCPNHSPVEEWAKANAHVLASIYSQSEAARYQLYEEKLGLTRSLLTLCLRALNALPNKKFDTINGSMMTYEIAAKIDAYFREYERAENGDEDTIVPAKKRGQTDVK